MMLRISLATAALFFTIPQTGRAEIVDNAIDLGPGGVIGEYRFGVPNLPNSTSRTNVSVGFSYDHGSLQVMLTGLGTNLDWGSDWYFVRAGDHFDQLQPQELGAREVDAEEGPGRHRLRQARRRRVGRAAAEQGTRRRRLEG